MRVALVTYDGGSTLLSADEEPLLAAFALQGHTASFVAWSDPGVEWAKAFDFVILRTTWDYHTRLPEFKV